MCADGASGRRFRAADLVGYRVLSTSASWHHHHGVRSADPVHIWLDVEGVGSLRLHTPREDVHLDLDTPHAGYDMGQYGAITVEHSGSPVLDALTGRVIEQVSALVQEATPQPSTPLVDVGFVLHVDGDEESSAVAIVNRADELVVEFWPPADSGSRLHHVTARR